MYFWNINALAKDLKENRVSEYEKMTYYLATALLIVLGTSVSAIIVTQRNIVEFLSVFIIVPILIFGILTCFKTNSAGDNKDFVGRMVCLTWVMAIRMAVIMICLAIVLFVIPVGIVIALDFFGYYLTPRHINLISTTFVAIIYDAVLIWYYFRINEKLKYVAGTKAT